MSKGGSYTLMQKDAEVVLAMSARGDNKHDIAAWFGVNQARIAEVEQGKGWSVKAATPDRLPPRGAPGPKGRRLREAIDAVLADLATEAYPLAKGWTLDLVETLRTSTRAAEALTTDKAAWKRNMVRTAILLAHPVKG